jgi:subtilisin family serine protease
MRGSGPAGPIRALTVLGLASLLLSAFIGCSGGGRESRAADRYAAYRAYDDELARRTALYEQDIRGTDGTFAYSPGVVHKTASEEVVTDESTQARVVADELVVMLWEDHTDDDLIRELVRLDVDFELVGFVPTFNIVQLRSPEVGDELISTIAALPFVDFVERHRVKETEQEAAVPTSTGLWHLDDFNIPSIWTESTGAGKRVAVVDTGMDLSLPDFAERIVNPYSVVTGTARFEDEVYYRDGDTTHVVDHGTKVASVVGASGAGESGNVGVAPGASIMPIQVFGFSVLDERLVSNDLMIIEGIARAIEFRADIINLSLGSDYSHIIQGDPLAAIEDTQIMNQLRVLSSTGGRIYERALTACEEHGVIVVASAGNEGLPAEVQPLAAHPNTFAIGAIDEETTVAGFSNYGYVVDCYAPGVDIPVLGTGGNTFRASGTSFSAPYVSGLIALAPGTAHRNVREALANTNFQARFTILPEAGPELFSPVGFYNALGGSVEYEDETEGLLRRFHDRYGAFFIDESDDDETKLSKVFGYYATRETIDASRDREARFAIDLIPRNTDFVIETIAREDQPAYYASILLSRTDVSPSVLRQAQDRLMESDYFAIVLNRHNVEEALPELHRRLRELPDRFNANTLYGVEQFADGESLGIVRTYLEATQKSERDFASDEEDACRVLTTLAIRDAGSVSAEDEALVLRSLERFQEQRVPVVSGPRRDPYIKYYYRGVTRMTEALVNCRNREGLRLAVRGLRLLLQDDEPSESVYRDLQEILNTSTAFGITFDFMTSVAEQRRQLDEFDRFIENARYENGRFRS